MTNAANTLTAAICALLLGSTCVVAAVGPGTAVAPAAATQQIA